MKPNGKSEPVENIARFEIIGDQLAFYDDDIDYAVFLRRVIPQMRPKLEAWQARMDSGVRLSVPELLRMLHECRQDLALIWAGANAAQKKVFEQKIAKGWLEVKEQERQIYEMAVRELERRKALS
jgi:hypothetical protein